MILQIRGLRLEQLEDGTKVKHMGRTVELVDAQGNARYIDMPDIDQSTLDGLEKGKSPMTGVLHNAAPETDLQKLLFTSKLWNSISTILIIITKGAMGINPQ